MGGHAGQVEERLDVLVGERAATHRRRVPVDPCPHVRLHRTDVSDVPRRYAACVPPAPDDQRGRPAAKVLTVSDSVHAGTAEDRSGPAVAGALSEAGFDVVEMRAVSDGEAPVAAALRDLADGFTGLVVTTGGTGFGPRDVTPEGTLAVLDRQAPGLAEAMRLADPKGRLSRGVAGTVGRCLVLNTPGSPAGATTCLAAVLDVVPHALALLAGEDPHPHGHSHGHGHGHDRTGAD